MQPSAVVLSFAYIAKPTGEQGGLLGSSDALSTSPLPFQDIDHLAVPLSFVTNTRMRATETGPDGPCNPVVPVKPRTPCATINAQLVTLAGVTFVVGCNAMYVEPLYRTTSLVPYAAVPIQAPRREAARPF
jgi:hypothetical protein